MNVAIDLSSSNHTKTGTYHYSLQLINELKKDKEISLIVFNGPKLLKSKGKIQKILNAIIEIIYLHLILPLMCMIKKVDVLHMPANIVPIWSTCPTVVTLHDLSVIRFPEKFDKLYALYAKLFFWLSSKRANKIITISLASKKEILNYYKFIPQEKIEVVYNGVNNFILNYDSKEERKKNQDYILFVGATEPWKNIPLLVEAFYLLTNGDQNFSKYKLYIIGSRGGDFENVIRIISELNLNDKVVYKGYVSDDELNEIYSDAKTLVLPSVNEGFGLPVIEAMAHGVPVIVSANGALPEIVGDSGIILEELTSKNIRDAIYDVINNEELQLKLIKRGKERYKLFSWETTARKNKNVYLELYKKGKK